MATVYVHPQALIRVPLMEVIKIFSEQGLILSNRRAKPGRMLMTLRPITAGEKHALEVYNGKPWVGGPGAVK